MMFRLEMILLLTFALVGCGERSDLALPSSAEVEANYLYEGSFRADVRGNVAVLAVGQSARQLRRGGALWAKVGPYIFLFSEETQKLLNEKIRENISPPIALSACPSCGEPSGGNGPCVFCREFGNFSV